MEKLFSRGNIPKKIPSYVAVAETAQVIVPPTGDILSPAAPAKSVHIVAAQAPARGVDPVLREVIGLNQQTNRELGKLTTIMNHENMPETMRQIRTLLILLGIGAGIWIYIKWYKNRPGNLSGLAGRNLRPVQPPASIFQNGTSSNGDSIIRTLGMRRN